MSLSLRLRGGPDRPAEVYVRGAAEGGGRSGTGLVGPCRTLSDCRTVAPVASAASALLLYCHCHVVVAGFLERSTVPAVAVGPSCASQLWSRR